MDHRILIASLPDDLRRRLTEKSDAIGGGRVIAYFCALAVTASYIAVGAPFWWALLLPHGIMLIFLFTLLHETSHATVFATTWPNRWVSAVCGFLVFVPAIWFRYFHLAHHRHTHDPDHDPELAAPKPETPAAYLWHISGLPVWWSQLKTLAQNAAGNVDYPYLPDTAKPRVVVEARVTLSLYAGLALASLAVGSTILLWIWLIPAALGQPFLRLYLLAEHGRCPHVANMLENTRTTFTNRIVRWLAWNMPYHAEHHAYPAVPFHKLPEFHAHTQAHLRQTENGYARFNRGYLAAIAAEAGAAPVK